MTSAGLPAVDGTAETDFLAAYDPAAFPPVALTVDAVALTIRADRLCVLLVERGSHPFRGAWALPGGFVRPDEDLVDAARREVREETGIDPAAWHLEQLAAYGRPGRDPRMRVVSVAYLALVPDLPVPRGGTDAAGARFWPVEGADGLPGTPALAFDHARILGDALERVRTLLEQTSVATSFLEEPFSVADLRRVYETVWGERLHAANFRRKVLATTGFLVPAEEPRAPGRGRPELFRRGTTARLHPPLLRSDPAPTG